MVDKPSDVVPHWSFFKFRTGTQVKVVSQSSFQILLVLKRRRAVNIMESRKSKAFSRVVPVSLITKEELKRVLRFPKQRRIVVPKKKFKPITMSCCLFKFCNNRKGMIFSSRWRWNLNLNI